MSKVERADIHVPVPEPGVRRVEDLPTVTTLLIAANVLIHFATIPSVLGLDLRSVAGNCIQPSAVVGSALRGMQPHRLITSAFVHSSDIHLYYNMASLLWKGLHLERRMGSRSFLKLVIFAIVCSNALFVMLSYALNLMTVPPHITGYNTCAAGFSAALFCLKYVWNIQSPDVAKVGDFQVQTQMVSWLELLLISQVAPSTCFQAHLAGILAGMLYVKQFSGDPAMH